MRCFEALLKKRDIAFDAADRQIMCFAHIIDLCSKRVTNNVNNTVDNSLQCPDITVGSDPIARGRDIVRVIRGSGMRREAFEEVIEDGNEKGWFKEGDPPKAIEIKPLQLLRDVPTRWDSIFLMLRRLRLLRQV